MTCLDNKINFLPTHTFTQIHTERLTHTDTGDHFVWQVAGEFSLVNRHYCEMAVYWIIITLSAINLVSVLSVCAGVCLCAGVYGCVCLSVCGCCWQVRDRRGLARLNYVYDYILLQKHTHAHTHTYTHCRTMRSHTNTRTHTHGHHKQTLEHAQTCRHLHTQMNLFSGCQPQCIEL